VSVRWLWLGAALAMIALVTLALLTPKRLPHQAGGRLVLGGTPVSAVPEVDFSKPLTLAGQGNPGHVTLDLSAAGIPLGSAEADTKPEGNGFTAQLSMPGITRWIVGGAVTATVPETGTQTFTVLTRQHPLASAMGAGSLILALFALAYLESGLRTIRNGYRWRGAPIAGPVLGLLFGAAAWLCVSALRAHEPSPGFGAGCAVAGGLAAGFVVLATRRKVRRNPDGA
jgi:serine/threonine-protein kinase